MTVRPACSVPSKAWPSAPSVAQLASKALAQETGGTAGDVDEFAHQIAVDARGEVVAVEVDVFHVGVELGGDVVAQPFGVHADAQVLERVQTGATALGHLLAVVDGHEAVQD